MASSSNCNNTYTIRTINEVFPLCSLPNHPDFANATTTCCGSAQVKRDSSNCRMYCNVEESMFLGWTSCVGRSAISANCQSSKQRSPSSTTSSVATPSSTSSSTPSPTATQSSSASNFKSVSKVAVFLSLLAISTLASASANSLDLGDLATPPHHTIRSRRTGVGQVSLRKGDDAFRCDQVRKVGESYTKAGGQIKMSGNMLCNGSDQPCSTTVGGVIPIPNSVVLDHGITTTDGASTSLRSGSNLLSFSSEVKGELSLAKAITDSLSIREPATRINTMSVQLNQVTGTRAYVWFSPDLDCQRHHMSCNGAEVDIEACVASKLPNGSAAGSYGLTYI